MTSCVRTLFLVTATMLVTGSISMSAQRGNCKKCDTQRPTVSITAPSASAVVSGTVPVSGSASDNVGVVKVELKVDSGAFVAVSGTASWSYSWVTTSITNGTADSARH